MFSSLSKGICLLGGFSLLSTDPLSQRAPLPLKPIFIPLSALLPSVHSKEG